MVASHRLGIWRGVAWTLASVCLGGWALYKVLTGQDEHYVFAGCLVLHVFLIIANACIVRWHWRRMRGIGGS